ncbi:ABC transporter substrate-binding protein [Nitratireductor soli]|uniref:ABC transporter substrate-binding protein n=1 Tax=Nitratireductor soli TaxID=1670619 RepID=UPI00065E14FE|nr:ABC transporter substrate-binding protein [Nitratireductor soli]
MVSWVAFPTAKGAASRRASRFVVIALGLMALGGASLCAHAEIVFVDAAGHQVRLDAPARRIVTNESLILLSLALIDPDPVARLAGWARPQRIDRGVYDAFRRKFPAMDDIPEIGAVVPEAASAEAILSVDPDLFVVRIWQPGWAPVAEQLAAAGVPVLFLDGPGIAGKGAGEATALSIELLGKAIGREDQAQAFSAFVRERFDNVAKRLEGLTERPDVLIDVHAGTLCCYTPGSGNRIMQYLQHAGGRSIGMDVPGYDGRLSAEHVLGADPDVYIGTGGPRFAEAGGLLVGAGVEPTKARAALKSVVGRNFLDGLSAVGAGRAHAISHQLSISALDVLAMECFAKWIHPALFADLDPAATLDEINRRFLAVPLEGTFWVDLRAGSSADGQ